MRKLGIILFLILSIFPIGRIHAQSSNVGFVSGNIWYSKDPFEEGDKIKIYTLIFNPDKRELSGTVVFFDKTVFLGKKDFIVPAGGVRDIFVNWTVTVGDHKIFGNIQESKFLVSKGVYEDVYLSSSETEKSERTVSKKIIPEIPKPSSTADIGDIENKDGGVSGTIQSIQETIKEGTPDFIAKPILATVNAVDGFRTNIGTLSNNKRDEVKVEIEAFSDNKNNTKILSDSKINSNKLLKPFKYVELFFFGLSSFIFNNKFIFYGILVVILFFMVRFIWRKIF